MAVRETKWVVTLDGNVKEASAEQVDALKAMAAEYETNKQALAQLNTALKASGKGTAEVTKSIKEQIEKLTARQAVVTADAAKQGQSIKSIIKQAKLEAAEREKAAKKIQQAEKDRAANQAKAFGMLGGRLGALRNKLVDVQGIMGEEGGKSALLKAALTGGADAALSLASAAAAAGLAIGVGLAAGIATATVALTKWVLLSASARAQTRLQMEAWVRTGENARKLADQVDELGRKVPTSTEELSKLAIGLRQAGIRGAPLVDSLNAIGQASAALGGEAASKLQDFITRYQRMGVVQINPMEMIGTGLDFDDIAGALAKQANTSIEKARAALATGAVKLGDGAKAMRTAIESKFAGINVRKLSDIAGAGEQIGKRLSSLTKDVNLEPITRFLDRIYKDLDESSITGQALKTLFESFAAAFGTSLDKNGDWIEYGLKESIRVSLDLGTEMVELKNKIESTFNDGKSAADKFNTVLNVIKASFDAISGGVTLPFQAQNWAAEAAAKATSGATANGMKLAEKLPAHARGGVVTGISSGVANTAPLPAAGEGLVSIGVGEAIVPASRVGGAMGGSTPSINVGDVYVTSAASDPKEVADEVGDTIVEKILAMLEIAGVQIGVR